MVTHKESTQLIGGLGIAIVAGLLGIAGATAALGYLLILAVVGAVFLATAGLALFAASFTQTEVATAGGVISLNGSSGGSFGEIAPPATHRSYDVPLALLAVVGGMALLPEMGILSSTNNVMVIPVLAALWGGGLGLMLLAQTRLRKAEVIAISGGGTIALVTMAAAMTGSEVGIAALVMGIGYVFAFAFGYGLYRLDQAGKQEERRIEHVEHTYSEDEIADSLMRIELFDRLNEEQRGQVAAIAQMREFESGQVMGTQGSTGDRLFCIVEGHVQLSVHSPLGELTVKVAEPGESLPLSVLIGSNTLVTTATALSDVSALMLPRAELLELCERRNDIGMCLFNAVADVLGARYRATLGRLTQRMEVQEPALWANM